MKLPLAVSLALVPLVLLAACTSTAERNAERVGLTLYNVERGLALEGYDPVSYFAEGGGTPVRGDAAITAEHRGVTYRFASEAHRELFVEAPERFVPAYGGWCAYAMADGERVDVDPRSFLLQDGALLLFYDGIFNDTRAMWRKEGAAELKAKADAAWARLAGELPAGSR